MTITERIQNIQSLITANTLLGHQPPILMAVSKQQPVNAIREAYAAGLRHFGENYWQELTEKQALLNDLPIEWHYIGAIQSKKCKALASAVNWIHTISRSKEALLLSEHRPVHLPPLNVCIEVNLDDEANKSGLLSNEILPLAKLIQTLPHLTLRGLMTIPKPCIQLDEQYISLLRLKEVSDKLNPTLTYPMDTLSMGMSDDLVAAVKAGSTILRIGRGIFGERAILR